MSSAPSPRHSRMFCRRVRRKKSSRLNQVHCEREGAGSRGGTQGGGLIQWASTGLFVGHSLPAGHGTACSGGNTVRRARRLRSTQRSGQLGQNRNGPRKCFLLITPLLLQQRERPTCKKSVTASAVQGYVQSLRASVAAYAATKVAA